MVKLGLYFIFLKNWGKIRKKCISERLHITKMGILLEVASVFKAGAKLSKKVYAMTVRNLHDLLRIFFVQHVLAEFKKKVQKKYSEAIGPTINYFYDIVTNCAKIRKKCISERLHITKMGILLQVASVYKLGRFFFVLKKMGQD